MSHICCFFQYSPKEFHASTLSKIEHDPLDTQKSERIGRFGKSATNLAGNRKKKKNGHNRAWIEIPYILIAAFNGSPRTRPGQRALGLIFRVGLKVTHAGRARHISPRVPYLSRGIQPRSYQVVPIRGHLARGSDGCRAIWVGGYTWAFAIERGAHLVPGPSRACVCVCTCGVVSSVNGLALCGSWNKVPPAHGGSPGEHGARLTYASKDEPIHACMHTHTHTHARVRVYARGIKRVAGNLR